MSIEKALSDFEHKLLTESKIVHSDRFRVQSFRCSSLPLCPIKWCMTEIVHDGKTPEEDNFSLDFYAGTGTHVHTVLQKWSAFHGNLYGDWECKHTQRRMIDGKSWEYFETVTVKDRLGPVECSLCHKQMQYKELVVREPETGLSGHVDMLLPYLDGFVVCDFKTSSAKKMEEMTEPPRNYHEQLQSYWQLLAEYGPWDEEAKKHRTPLKIYGSSVIFMQRDNPFDKAQGMKMFLSEELNRKILLRNCNNYKIAKEALDTGDFERVSRRGTCKTKEESKYCEYACLGCMLPDPDKRAARVLKNLNLAYKERLDDYEAKVSAPQCPS